ncbi:MAG: sigma-70 family RNA polymerase sigma factor [candidate division Zixibacteria bacterium]|nr:sigma-70 family RNA polymerase sigma factor [candidate division Zixibacteria bacterium]
MDYIDKDRIRELVRRCLMGDNDAWDALMRNLIPIGAEICGRMRLTSEEALEIIAQCNYLLLKNLRNLNEPEKVFSYYHTMIINEIRGLLRGKKRDRDSEESIKNGIYKDLPKNPEELLSEKLLRERIRKAIDQLPEECIELIKLLFQTFPRPTYKEISKKLKIPESSIGPKRQRCLDKLREILFDGGFDFLVLFLSLITLLIEGG